MYMHLTMCVHILMYISIDQAYVYMYLVCCFYVVYIIHCVTLLITVSGCVGCVFVYVVELIMFCVHVVCDSIKTLVL